MLKVFVITAAVFLVIGFFIGRMPDTYRAATIHGDDAWAVAGDNCWLVDSSRGFMTVMCKK